MTEKVIPEDNKAYATREYWEERYKQEPEPFDWFKDWVDLKDLLSKHIQRSDEILMLGCGNSKLSEQMYDDQYHRITNIDFSPTVIEVMKERCKEMPEMTWLEMDVTDMRFNDNSFDIALDKGTMDALLCEQVSAWEVDDHLAEKVNKMLSEIYRCLRPKGKYVYITWNQPHFRKNLLMKEKYNWSLQIEKIGEFLHYFIYILTKND